MSPLDLTDVNMFPVSTFKPGDLFLHDVGTLKPEDVTSLKDVFLDINMLIAVKWRYSHFVYTVNGILHDRRTFRPLKSSDLAIELSIEFLNCNGVEDSFLLNRYSHKYFEKYSYSKNIDVLIEKYLGSQLSTQHSS